MIQTRQGKLLGVPSAKMGTGYCTLILLCALVSGCLTSHGWLMLMVSAGTVVLSVYLVHALLVHLKVRCVLCFISHVINLLLFLLLLGVV